MRRRASLFVLVAVLAAPVGLLVPVLVPDPPSGAVLTSEDRAAIGDPGVERGADPAPAVLPLAPDAVARAYLRAAHAAVPGQAGRSGRAGTPFAAPGSAAAVGGPVLDPPGPGRWRVAVVEALEPAGLDPGRGRSAFVARVRTTTAAPGEVPRTTRWRTRVVLHRGPGDRWLVVADTPVTPDTPDVDD